MTWNLLHYNYNQSLWDTAPPPHIAFLPLELRMFFLWG